MTLADWIKQHRGIFLERNYSIEEAYQLCQAAGFPKDEINQVLANWPRVLWGQSSDNIAKFEVDRELGGWMRWKCLDLSDQWHALGRKLLYDKDFDD